jgi:hypothetical protein
VAYAPLESQPAGRSDCVWIVGVMLFVLPPVLSRAEGVAAQRAAPK